MNFIELILTKRLFLILAILLLTAGIIGAITYSGVFQEQKDDGISHYTCPMHPQIKDHNPGTCPICHMDLVPVYKAGYGPDGGKKGQKKPEPGEVEISSDRQQMIGVRVWTVKKEKLVGELEATGRVAFDPELAVAVREYMQVARRDPSLRRAAESRLRLLGMGNEEIRGLVKNSDEYASLYQPGEGNAAWIYATIYENEAGSVQPGAKALIEIPDSGEVALEGTVRSLSPLVDAKTRSITARIQVPTKEKKLRPDTFVNVRIQLELGEGPVVPVSAILDTGKMKVVYLVVKGETFRPVQILTGTGNDHLVLVKEGLREGDVVVSRAAFMIDSESRLQSPGFYPEDRKGQMEQSHD